MKPAEFQRLFGTLVAQSLANQQALQMGTTVQRPSNPTPGARYFDTTLAGAGKVIYFVPPNWVDATGTIV